MEELEKLRKIKMLFVLGKPRSGTSLLQNLLDGHPGIIGGPESKFIALFYPKFGHIKKWKPADVVEFAEMLYKERLFATIWYLDKKSLTETLLSLGENVDYPTLCKAVHYQMRKDKENVIYISDKNPEYIIHVKTLLKIFPDAKCIHIIREPRDNMYSEVSSFNVKNTLFRAYQWVGYHKVVEKMKKKDPKRYLTVLYESVVLDTEATMRKVCDFLELPFSDDMTQNKSPEWLNAHLERRGVTDREKLVHRNLLKPVDASNIGKWKNKLSPYNQTVAEIVTGDFAKKTYGYDIDSNPATKPIKISRLTLLKAKCIYYAWQRFTTWRFRHFRVNMMYSRLKRRMNKDLPIWEFF